MLPLAFAQIKVFLFDFDGTLASLNINLKAIPPPGAVGALNEIDPFLTGRANFPPWHQPGLRAPPPVFGSWLHSYWSVFHVFNASVITDISRMSRTSPFDEMTF
jgi:hypothetical protein